MDDNATIGQDGVTGGLDDRLGQIELMECFCEDFTAEGFHEPKGFDDIWHGFQGRMALGDSPYAVLEGISLVGKTNLVRGFAARIGEGRCIRMLKGRVILHVSAKATAPEVTPESAAFDEYMRRFGGRDCPGRILYIDDIDAAKAFLPLHALSIPVIVEIRNNGTEGIINVGDFTEERKCITIEPDNEVGENVSLMQGIVSGDADHFMSRYGTLPSPEAVEVITKMMLVGMKSASAFQPAKAAVVIDNFMSECTSEKPGAPTADDAYAFAEKDFEVGREAIDSLPAVLPGDDDDDGAAKADGPRHDGDDGDDGLVFHDRADLMARLKTRVIGQDAALEEIVGPLVRRKAGLGDVDKPIASLLLAGPSGVGKTETAMALAEAAFGDPKAFKRVDCGEMVNEMGVSRLLGSAQGYSAFDSGGELSNFIAAHPHSVILFDEIEKADDRFYDSLFLQLMSAGRLTGSVRTDGMDGRPSGSIRTVDARGCIIIMTSNVGSQGVGDDGMNRTGFGGHADDDSMLEDSIRDSVRHNFRVEFINRLDGIVVFRPLDPESLGRVFMLKWKPNEERILKRRGISIDMDGSVPAWFADRSRKDRFGARNLIRAMDDALINPLADIVLEKDGKGGTLHVKVSEDGKELDIS